VDGRKIIKLNLIEKYDVRVWIGLNLSR